MQWFKYLAFFLGGIIVILGVSGCDEGQSQADEVQVITATPPPTISLPAAEPTDILAFDIAATETPVLSQLSQPEACEPDPGHERTRYEVEALVDWSARRIQVDQTVRYRNDYDTGLETLVFHVEANRLNSSPVMTFQGVLSEGGAVLAGASLDDTRLVVPLPEILMPGCETSLRLIFSIQLPLNSNEGNGRLGYLGYSERQLNAAHWLPSIGIFNGKNWLTPRKHPVGEQAIPEAADYRVQVKIENAPGEVVVAGPGQVSQQDNGWIFELAQARDFAFSMSLAFETATLKVSQASVELYYFPSTAINGAGTHALDVAAKALELYSELYGDYQYERLVVVQGDFPDGMEFSGLVFVGSDWFEAWNGTQNSWLTMITAHEVSHQWWYAQVANDQGMTPYLDEALATYSELLFFERYYPQSVQWWWDFRVLQHPTEAPVDSTVYEFPTHRPYIDAVYLRSSLMMDNIRQRVGDEAFFSWLQDYASQNSGLIAQPIDFWGSMDEAEYLLIADIRREYLAEPEILPTEATQDGISAEQAPSLDQ
jgi:hypothetical protein